MIHIDEIENVLSRGKPWPPVSEIDRLRRISENEQLFNGNHAAVYTALNKLFSNASPEYRKLLVLLNWHKRLSLLWADFLFGEKPIINIDPEDANNLLQNVLRNTNFFVLQHSRQIDVSRFGIGIIEILMNDGKVQFDVIHPSRYIEIVDDANKTIEHLIWWTNRNKLFLKVHGPGYITTKIFNISTDSKILDMVGEFTQSTGIDTPLISVVKNISTSGNDILDDYNDIDPIIKRLETRLTRVGRILDVHSEPLFYVPEDSGIVQKTEDGKWIYDSSKRVLILENDKVAPGYVTWDGQLNGAFQEIDFLIHQLYTISETCEACFEPSKIGANVSGTALRLMLFIPLRKVDRLKTYVDPAIKYEISTAYKLLKLSNQGLPDINNINILWNDGLPQDEKEMAANISLLYSQGLISRETALKKLYNFNDEEIVNELEKISEAENQGII